MANGDFVVGRDIDFQYADPEDTKKKVKKRVKKKKSAENVHESTNNAQELSSVWEQVEQNLRYIKPNDTRNESFFSEKSHPKKPKARASTLKKDPRKLKMSEIESDGSKPSRTLNKKSTRQTTSSNSYRGEGSPYASPSSTSGGSYRSGTSSRHDPRTGNPSLNRFSPNSRGGRTLSGRNLNSSGRGSSNGHSASRQPHHYHSHHHHHHSHAGNDAESFSDSSLSEDASNHDFIWETLTEDERDSIMEYWKNLPHEARKELLHEPDKDALQTQIFGRADLCSCDNCLARRNMLMETVGQLCAVNTKRLNIFSEKLVDDDNAFIGHLELSIKSHLNDLFKVDYDTLPFKKLSFDDMENPDYAMSVIARPPSLEVASSNASASALLPSDRAEIDRAVLNSETIPEFSRDCGECQRDKETDTTPLHHSPLCSVGRVLARAQSTSSSIEEVNSKLSEEIDTCGKPSRRGQYESVSEMKERTQEQLRTIARFTNGFNAPDISPYTGPDFNVEDSDPTKANSPSTYSSEKDHFDAHEVAVDRILNSLASLQQTDPEEEKNMDALESEVVRADFDPAQVEKFDSNSLLPPPNSAPRSQQQDDIPSPDRALKDLTSDIVHNQGLKFLEVYDTITEQNAEPHTDEGSFTAPNPFMFPNEEFSKDAKNFVKETFKQTFMDKVREAARDPSSFPAGSDLENPFHNLSLQTVENAKDSNRPLDEDTRRILAKQFGISDPLQSGNMPEELKRLSQAVSSNKIGLADILRQFDKFLKGSDNGFFDPRISESNSSTKHLTPTCSPLVSNSNENSPDSSTVSIPPYSYIKDESVHDSKAMNDHSGVDLDVESHDDTESIQGHSPLMVPKDLHRIITSAWYMHYLYGRIFETRTLKAYREHAAHERQEKLLAELAAEEAKAADQALRKQREKDKKKSRKLAARQQREEEERKKSEEAARKAELAREKEEKRRIQQLEADRAKQEAHRRRIEERLSKLALQDDQEKREKAKAQAEIDAKAKAEANSKDTAIGGSFQNSPAASTGAAHHGQDQILDRDAAVGKDKATFENDSAITNTSEHFGGERNKKKGPHAQAYQGHTQVAAKKQSEPNMAPNSESMVNKESNRGSQSQITGNLLRPQHLGPQPMFPQGNPLLQDPLLGIHGANPISKTNNGLYGVSVDPSTPPFVPMSGLESQSGVTPGVSTGMSPTKISNMSGIPEVSQTQNTSSSASSRASGAAALQSFPVSGAMVPPGVYNFGSHPHVGSIPLDDNEGLPSNLGRGTLGGNISTINQAHRHQALPIQHGALNANSIRSPQHHQQQPPIQPNPLGAAQHKTQSAISPSPINPGVRNLWSVPGPAQLNVPQSSSSWSRSLWGDDWSDSTQQKANPNTFGSFVGSSPWENASDPVWSDKKRRPPSKEMGEIVRNSYKQVQNTGIDGYVACHVLHNTVQKHLNGTRVMRNEFFKLCEAMEGFDCIRDEMGLITHVKL